MNCETCRARLAERVYGEVNADERAAIDEHLEQCNTCCGERDKLAQGRELLESARACPDVRVDVGRVYQLQARRAEQSERRWRRGAFALCTAAALVGVIAMSGLRIAIQPGEVSLSWREQPRIAEPAPANTEANQINSKVPKFGEALERQSQRLAELDELARLIVKQLDAQDRTRDVAVTTLQRQIDTLRADTDARIRQIKRDVRPLFTSQIASAGNNSTTGEER